MRRIIVFMILALFVAASIGATGALAARDYISIVGSSTVYPFATVVAEQFGKTTKFKTPKIESTGSGGGFKLFCAGVGTENPDITNASRRIKKSEQEMCAKNGIADIIEVKVGYDGIVISGRSEKPVYVWIHDGKTKILDASLIWGKGVYAVRDILKQMHGKNVRIVTTGVAGENMCRSANLMTDNEGSATGGFGLGKSFGGKS